MPISLFLMSSLNSTFKLVLLPKVPKRQEIIKMLWIALRILTRLRLQLQLHMMLSGGIFGISEMLWRILHKIDRQLTSLNGKRTVMHGENI